MEKATSDIIEIDGSFGEGGGQMFRNSLALSTIFDKTVKIEKIRALRPNPGMNNQLLTGVKPFLNSHVKLDIMRQVSDAKLSGVGLKSQNITYVPQGIKGGSFFGDCKTAGSVALMTQMVTPAFLYAPEPSTVCLRGGTFVSHSPPILYTQLILFPLLKKFGIKAGCEITKNGYYPSGGGQIELTFDNVKEKLKPIELTTPGKIKKIYIECITNLKDEATATDYMKDLKKDMKKVMRTKYTEEDVDAIEFELVFNYSESLMKHSLPTFKKQAKNNKQKGYKPPENKEKRIVYGVLCFAYGDDIFFDCSVAENEENESDAGYFDLALTNFTNYFKTGACIDDHTQDQLLLFMLLADGVSKIRCTKEITDHTKSCFYIFKKFYPDFTYKLYEENDYIDIEIQGIGFLRELPKDTKSEK